MILTSGAFKKSSKQNKIIALLIVGIIAVSILIAVLVGHFAGKDTETTTNDITSEATETVGDIVITDDITDESGENKETTETEEMLTLNEPTTEKETNKTASSSSTQNSTATAVTASSGGTSSYIIGDDSVNEYSCSVSGHHCDSKETHNFIVSLEEKGCPYCGSHSCKSFYALDEWGNACYDPTKCESYNAKSDPCEYCQECGKEVGDGSDGTCVRFNTDTKCPVCGKTVKAKTCHSH